MAWSRWLFIQKIKRNLTLNETVDHINGNQLDDRISNLQLLSREDNNRKSALGRHNPYKGIEKGWRHGTFYGWMKKKCKCKKCIAAKKKYYIERNAKRRKGKGYGLRFHN